MALTRDFKETIRARVTKTRLFVRRLFETVSAGCAVTSCETTL